VARERPAATRAGGAGDPDEGQPVGRAALHRQAVLRRRVRAAVLDPPADRRAGPAPAPDAPFPRLADDPSSSCDPAPSAWRWATTPLLPNSGAIRSSACSVQLGQPTLDSRDHSGRPPPSGPWGPLRRAILIEVKADPDSGI